ncbi:hypothetical protein M011DRAFT_524953 [Sporormia fimetaria CBS 119925]|uniref:Uncharacterized protein n=1 Tax=Sporormia fimetaria CBS 119925 TaxID=1340428 RepID=A0A6A6VGQ8_9PLEO|nr:hypothetical protein M011DRAFT_524953 [Sporormia fimetaria CBS 119925]
MATEFIAQEVIAPEIKTESLTVVREVRDIAIEEPTIVPALEKPWMCYYPVSDAPKLKPRKNLTKEFFCEHPSVEPNVYRTTDPLPFPGSLKELISWTDAFVDKIASVTQEEAEAHADTNRRNEQLKSQLDILQAELAKSRDETKAANDRVDEVEKALRKAETDVETSKKTIAQMLDDDKKQLEEISRLGADVQSWKQQHDDVVQKMNSQKEAFEKADAEAAKRFWGEHEDHMEDHNALEKVRKQLCEETEARMKVEGDLRQTSKTLSEKTIALEASKKTNKDLTERLARSKISNDTLTANNEKLRGEVRDLKKDLYDVKEDLQKAVGKVEKVNKELDTARGKIASQEQELRYLKEKNAELDGLLQDVLKERDAAKAERDEKVIESEGLRKELAEVKQRVEELKIAIEATKTEWQAKFDDLNKSNEDLQADLEAARERRDDAVRDCDVLRKEVTRLEKKNPTKVTAAMGELEDLRSQVTDLKAQLEATTKRLVPNPNKRTINILTFEYGSKAYTEEEDPELFEKLYTFAEKDQAFKVNNALVFNKDPMKGHDKSFSITYQVDGSGMPKHLFGEEGQSVRFRKN